MALTQIDKVTALIVIDLQKGIVAMPVVHPAAGIVDRAARLARAFRELRLPVILVNVTGRAPGRTDAGPLALPPSADWAEFVPELERHPDDHIVSKQRWGAFIGTPLDDYLRDRGVTQVVMAGIATSAGVESTARSAYDYGYSVALVTDAMTDRNAEAHRHSIDSVFPRIGETTTTVELLTLLKQQR